MDTTLIVILGSMVIILITILIGFKKNLDLSKELNLKLKDFEIFTLENQKVLSSSIEEKSLDIIEKLRNEIMKTLEKNVSMSNEQKLLVEQFLNLTEKEFIDLKKQNEVNFSQIIKNEDSTQKIILEYTNKVNEKMETLIKINEKNLNILDKNTTNIQIKIENNFQNMVQLVNNLRLDNLINVSNEISKYKQGIYEDEHFLQEVGFCKIIKISDKKSGDITNVYYDENGQKLNTETYNGEVLKYSMQYENNKLKIGKEFDANGKISFEYFYDDLEEIVKKIEYIYGNNSQLQTKNEINY